MHNLTSQRFETFWHQISPSYSDHKLAIIGSENPLNFGCIRTKHLCHFISNEKDSLRDAKRLGFMISTNLESNNDIIILELTKSRETNLGLLSLAEEHLNVGGKMIIIGDNQIGIKSFLKKVSIYWTAEIIVTKKKGKIAIFPKTNKSFGHWKKFQDFRINRHGYYTRCDMFSPKEIDKGSQKLTSAFSANLFGEVADLGAGWGYMSKEALRLNEKITKITLFESNYSAYLASKKNVDDERATFRWASLKDITNLKRRFNHIICNPPFHSGRSKDLSLLKSFIFHSSRLINAQGCVWMVFVAGVYLENELQEYFEKIKVMYRDKHYFVCQLLKPKTKEYKHVYKLAE